MQLGNEQCAESVESPWLLMAREKATPKSTGGGGFTFADKVAAAFLARPLRRDLILGADVGPIAEIDFETRESGNLLDDLQITLRGGRRTA